MKATSLSTTGGVEIGQRLVCIFSSLSTDRIPLRQELAVTGYRRGSSIA